MAQPSRSVSVNFRMDAELKEHMEEICQRMGITLSTLWNIVCKKIEQERRIPFEITADADPFYSESTVRELKRRMDDIRNGTAVLEEHELIEIED